MQLLVKPFGKLLTGVKELPAYKEEKLDAIYIPSLASRHPAVRVVCI